MTNIRITLVRASFWAALLRISTRALNLLQLVLLSRVLGPEDFGLFGVAMLVYGFVEAMTQLGFADALIQRASVQRAHINTLFVVSIIRGVLLAALTLLLIYPATLLVDDTRVAPFIAAIGVVPIIAGFHNPSMVLLQKKLDLRAEFLYRVIGTVVALLVSFCVAMIYRSAWALVIGMMVESAIQLIGSYWVNRTWPTFRFNRSAFDDMFGFGRWLLLSQILKYFALNSPRWAVAGILGTASLGTFQVAARLSQAVGTEFAKLVATVAFPAFSALASEQARIRQAFLTSQRLIASASGLIFALVIAMPGRIVNVLLGGQWIEAVPAVALMGVLGAFQAIGGQVEVLKALGKARVIATMTLLRTIFVLSLVYPLTSWLGLEGAVLAALIPMVAIYFFTAKLVIASLQVSARELLVSIAPALSAALGMIGLILMTGEYLPGGVVGLIASGIWGCFLYVMILVWVDRRLGGEVRLAYQAAWQPVRERFRPAAMGGGF